MLPNDGDPQETAEWLAGLEGVLEHAGPERVRYLLDTLHQHFQRQGGHWHPNLVTPYCNTIAANEQAPYPGDLDLEQRLAAIMRWNAMVMVVRANRLQAELGGHIASYASAADLFEVGFNHFFQARQEHDQNTDPNAQLGDLVFFQPHSAPGVYARAFLEGRLPASALEHYRREVVAQQQGLRGLSSYPHPWLQPDFWQFPTGSMGIGPLSAIYQARFMRYLEHRQLYQHAGQHVSRKVWGFFGDGEMDEPESLAALSLAAREQLDNLIFVINCNLQRLDGPVRGNGRVIDELEALFTGAGWHVIKVLWGSDWDGLFARDKEQALLKAFAQTVDGQFQTFSANDGRFNRERFFGQNPALQQLVAGMSDAEIDRLRRGGHDFVKIHAAYSAARAHRGQPTVVLAKTMKGYGMGEVAQGRMTTHQQKKLDLDDLFAFRNRFALPLSDAQVEALDFYQPPAESAEMQYLHARRQALGGYLPARSSTCPTLAVPAVDTLANFALQANGKEMSTTMAFVRLLGNLLKDPTLGPRVVPIVADEARTFGMANLFRQIGIYSPHGQRYEPEDAGSLTSYREAQNGQILEEGISEAGALASWTAAATAYSVHGQPLLPFYIFYSMFGFQRVGDLIWAAADQRPRGFLLGATAGRTTLGGEGLQHQDGHSHLIAATVPNCRAYDPAYAGELAVIIQHGLQRMLVAQEDAFYYLTVGNANYAQASLDAAHHEGVIRGAYCLASDAEADVILFGSGALMPEVLAAQALLAEQGIRAAIWSITSYTELARDGAACERAQRLGLDETVPYIQQALVAQGYAGQPIIAVTDYQRALPEMLRAYLPTGASYTTLGTDGFGRSDGRAALRDYFEVSAGWIADAAIYQLSLLNPVYRAARANFRAAVGLMSRAVIPWQQ
ncbi:alpha-ketoglutarate dehydrogenase [Parvibium lacunae]|uniref:Pyruvate dehydrogenase E1 component n=1 Tax=Parvibium lacunae TaxID=1888893 RepID=A0A368L4X2_9BURK|nr:alpha-ketoglutarate dehydrogenase [Parvibium lacunae]RCS58617.1 alpha-ketoglutarate dehydrogenase [Parvibium lacunae]